MPEKRTSDIRTSSMTTLKRRFGIVVHALLVLSQFLSHRLADGPSVALQLLRANEKEEFMARYGEKASSKVERAMHERKHGTLKSGRSGKKVTSRKQAKIGRAHV